jgi:hypothetical protein
LDFFRLPREHCLRLVRAAGKAWAGEPDKTIRAHVFLKAWQTEHREIVFQAVIDLAEQLGIQGDADRMVRIARLNEKPLMWILTRPEFRATKDEMWWLRCAVGEDAKDSPSYDGFMEKYATLTCETARFTAALAISRKDQEYAMHIVSALGKDDDEVRRLLRARYCVRRQFPHAKLGRRCMLLKKFERATTMLEICRRSDCAIALGMESFAFPLGWYLAVREKVVQELSETKCWD